MPPQSFAPPRLELLEFLRHVGKDPSRLAFEDELTELHNRRFLKSYLEHKVRWETGEDFPLALLVIDLDHFKSVNDLHGHAIGDQALGWVATLLREVAGPKGIPVRYAGDEFVILLPEATREDAVATAERLVALARERPFRVRDSGLVLPIHMSVGVASAPEDASDGRGLFHAADTALYHAKRSGRDQAAHAGEVDPGRVFPKTALQRLRFSPIGGRSRELAAVADALSDLRLSGGRALLFEGGPGMGKTALLESVRGHVAGPNSPPVVRVAGDAREGGRPYYLAQRMLAGLLELHPDRRASILTDLPPELRPALSAVLPRLEPEGPDTAPDGDGGRAIFDALVHGVPRAAGFGSLVVLADDLHEADEPSLRVLRALLGSPDTALLLIGTLRAIDPAPGQETPLARFVAALEEASRVRRMQLDPLSAADIAEYLQEVFPRLATPPGFAAEIARTTGGHPLFLSEIVRKLIADRQVVLENLQWVARPIEPGYLPRSLDEIVLERMEGLDAGGRELLDRASAIGSETPVSLLSGSAEAHVSRVLEVLDQAEDLGLVRLDFESDEEILRFPGSQVRDIAYERIEPERRERLHEQIGAHAERLYEQRLLPSASMVAYQFQRSGNREKARFYERMRDEEFRRLGGPERPDSKIEEDAETERPLDPASVPHVPRVIRSFTKVVRDAQLYPPGSATVARSLHELHEAIEAVLEKDERLHLAQRRRALVVNGHRLPLSGAALQADAFLEILAGAELQEIAFHRGVDEAGLRLLVEEIVSLKSNTAPPGHWREFLASRGPTGIELEQVRYARVVRRHVPAGTRAIEIRDDGLGPDDLRRIPAVIRAFHGASAAARLYPVESPRVAAAIAAFHDALQEILRDRGALTLAWTEDSLLANGVRVDPGLGGDLAVEFMEELREAGLESVSWTPEVRPSDLAVFVATLRNGPSGAGREAWDTVARENALAGIAFNARPYSSDVVRELLEWADEESETLAAPDHPDPALSPTSAALLESLPATARDLLARGELDRVGRLVRGLLAGFRDEEQVVRERALRACRSLLESLGVALQRDFVELATDPLLETLAVESDPAVLREFGLVLTSMANIDLRFGDYTAASRVLGGLKERRERLDQQGGGSHSGLLDPSLEPAVQMLLVEILRSRDPDQQAGAVRVLGNLGRTSVPLLVETIRSEPDFRVRLMVASLLEETGWAGAKEVKRALATETVAARRIRLLEVADRITRDLAEELRSALSDPEPGVRAEGFRLFHRLERDDLVDLLVPYAGSDDPELAATAIHALAALGTAPAVASLVQAMRTTACADSVIACCRAFGQSGSLAGVDALVQVLEERRLRFFGLRWSEPVRAAAAAALAQVSHPRAAATLARLVDDPHPWVRDLARGAHASAPVG